MPKNRHLKNVARSRTQRAIETRQLIRPDQCQWCGGLSPEAHHPDYAKPLVILWLCRQCHGLQHQVENRQERAMPRVAAQRQRLREYFSDGVIDAEIRNAQALLDRFLVKRAG